MADSPARVADLLRRSLALLAAEVPDSHRRVHTELGPAVVEVTTDDETFTIRADGPSIVVTDCPADTPGIRIGTTRGTILAVVDAESTLAEAVETDALTVRGSVDDVLRAHDALLAYAHAAARAPGTDGLLGALRAGADR